jgi:radical SAM protein with 4Fe4S-binding SPASM domain
MLSTGGIISNALFTKIVKDLKNFPKPIELINIGEYAEPLLHPQFPDLVKIVKDSGRAKKIKMSTNASLLTASKADELIAAGIDFIQISINGINDQHYQQVTGCKINFEEILNNVKYLYSIKKDCHVHIKCIGDFFSAEQKDMFLTIFSPFADTIFIEDMANQWIDISLETKNTSNRFGFIHAKESLICSRSFYTLAIHHHGKASMCPVDWKFENTIGDVYKESLVDIWNGTRLNEIRKAHLCGKTENLKNCGKCRFWEFMASEDLTPYREELKIKYGVV